MNAFTYCKPEVLNDVLVVTIDCPGKVNKVSSAMLNEMEVIINDV
jgi:enoyl-CoA hydratase/carnithine racemase